MIIMSILVKSVNIVCYSNKYCMCSSAAHSFVTTTTFSLNIFIR